MPATATKKRTKKSTAKKVTHVALVLDSSGSMAGMKDAAIEMFNSQRDAIAKSGGGTKRVTQIVFGGDVRVLHDSVAPTKIPRASDEVYRPMGCTPMRDAIGRAITMLEAADDGGADTAFLVVVVTDGYENASREWSASALSAKVEALQATGRWTFGLYGANNLDLTKVQADAGLASVPLSNVSAYTPTAAGLVDNSLRASGHVSVYFANRAAGQTASLSYTGDDAITTTAGTRPLLAPEDASDRPW